MKINEAGAAMAEMREEIDRLMLANRELDHQVDKERIARLARIAVPEDRLEPMAKELLGRTCQATTSTAKPAWQSRRALLLVGRRTCRRSKKSCPREKSKR